MLNGLRTKDEMFAAAALVTNNYVIVVHIKDGNCQNFLERLALFGNDRNRVSILPCETAFLLTLAPLAEHIELAIR